MRKLLAISITACLLMAGIAHAQVRTLPANAKRAIVGQQQALPNINLGGTTVRLAPGGVIYDQNNRTVVHGALPPGADVAYVLDMNGDVGRIYILTPQEQAQFVPRK
jgi:hypothetical protein